jgi:hypothetical protein
MVSKKKSTFPGEMFSCEWLSNGLVDFKNEYKQTKYPCLLQTYVCEQFLRERSPQGREKSPTIQQAFLTASYLLSQILVIFAVTKYLRLVNCNRLLSIF